MVLNLQSMMDISDVTDGASLSGPRRIPRQPVVNIPR